ncbi:hypothetical protein [Kribbella sp. NPDC050470]
MDRQRSVAAGIDVQLPQDVIGADCANFCPPRTTAAAFRWSALRR